MKKPILFALLMTAAVGGGAEAQGLTLGEHYALRSYTGKAFGQIMAGPLGFKSLHVLTNNTTICAALVGAMGSGYLDLEGARRLQVTPFASPEEVGPLTPKEEAVALIFGGQATPEVNYALTRNTLQSLAKAGYGGAIFFHLRVWAPGFVARAAQEDPAIARYLAAKENLYAVTADLNAKVVRLWQVAVKEGKQATVKELGTIALNPAWEDLLRRSL